MGGEPVASRSEVLGNGTIGSEEPMGLSWRLEPWHAPFPLAGGLMGVLRSVIQIPMLTISHARQELSLGGFITLQLIRDDDLWSVLASFEEITEKLLRRLLVTPALHQDIENVAVLIDGPPEIMA